MQATTKVLFDTKCLNYCRRLICRNVLPAMSPQVIQVQHQSCKYSTAAADILPPPESDISKKLYPPKIQKLVEDISHLTLLEVADLNELLKKTLNIRDAPIMAMAAAAAAPKVEEEVEVAPQREKVNFTVKLVNFQADKKVQLIKEVKNLLEGVNLVQAKKFVESLPQVVKADITKEEAEKLKESLVAVGAEVVVE
ncbi:unnamed protein product [Candidula unifasciata]|uniref:Large ribosomal subunit protein bL12m n=1 Tax=Candidula unifasciata TaxID=100452 RepID=A0A8S3Z037_9EUPU|nr:unnamed protein product [Candidula unifasciata]